MEKMIWDGPKCGRKGLFPANPDLADILGDMDFDFDNVFILYFFGGWGVPKSGFSDLPKSGFPDFPKSRLPGFQKSGFPDFQKIHTAAGGAGTDGRTKVRRTDGRTDRRADGRTVCLPPVDAK